MSNKNKLISKQILTAVENAENILLTCHEKPDGDAVGSMLAIYVWLKNLNKQLTMYSVDEVPKKLSWLAFSNLITNNKEEIKPSFAKATTDKKSNFDLVIFLDCGCKLRNGLTEIFCKKNKTINIDHHKSNDNFGDINLVDSTKSSTAEIIFELFKDLKIKINSTVANDLLTGIITDTDFLNHSNTSPETTRAVSELIKLGGKTNEILKNIYQQDSIKKLQIWGHVLSRLKIDKTNGLAVTALTAQDFIDFKIDKKDLDGFTNLLNFLDTQGAMFLTEEEKGIIRGNLRSTCDDVDVLKIAQKYGGGGHPRAAGFKVKGKIIRTKKGEWRLQKDN